MNIRNLISSFSSLSLKDYYDEKIINQIKQAKDTLSKSEKKFINKILSEFRKYDHEYISKVIVLYSIWCGDEAIEIARKKGVFRYKAWGFKENCAKAILLNIESLLRFFDFSQDTKNFIFKKLNLSWLFNFYKKTEHSLIDFIRIYHSKREKMTINNFLFEESLFKDLLAYLDIIFYQNNRTEEFYNKNKLSNYSHEEISEGISYIIFLYNSNIGFKEHINYFVSDKFVLSDDIENLILKACKMNQLQEWELSIDYFNYDIKKSHKEITIYDKDENFEKSIRLGYVKNQIQQYIFHSKNAEKKSLSFEELVSHSVNKIENILLTEVGSKKISRYRLEFPIIFLEFFYKQEGFFQEEVEAIEYACRELIMDYDDISQKKITDHCTLTDVVLFQRFFLLTDAVASKLLFSKPDINKVIRSLVPSLTYKELISILIKFLGEEKKAIELLDLFTYDIAKQNNKLDLQYTPFIKIGDKMIFSTSIVKKSDLLRNCIAHSYASNNKIVNQDDRETLVRETKEIFKQNQNFEVFSNLKFKYNDRNGEIDVLAISNQNIFLIECKAPLVPTSNFELRASYEHIIKATDQLDLSKLAFSDESFRKKILKSLKIGDTKRQLNTCIVFGNRLLNGYSFSEHPIRYVRELDMIINNGHISYLGKNKWRVWQNEEFEDKELCDFLSSTNVLLKINFDAMQKKQQQLFLNNMRIYFETFVFDPIKAACDYNNYFYIVSK